MFSCTASLPHPQPPPLPQWHSSDFFESTSQNIPCLSSHVWVSVSECILSRISFGLFLNILKTLLSCPHMPVLAHLFSSMPTSSLRPCLSVFFYSTFAHSHAGSLMTQNFWGMGVQGNFHFLVK